MTTNNYKFKHIKGEEFLLYLDWLTRFKNPVNNLLRVIDKIIAKNCIEPKFNSSKLENISLFKKFTIAKLIWESSLENLKIQPVQSNENLKEFLIYEEIHTFNINILLEQLKFLEYENDIENQSYKELRKQLFLPIDALVEYFQKAETKPDFLERLILKKKSKLPNKILFEEKSKFTSIKMLFIVEGITEEKILPVMAAKNNLNFSYNGIKLFAAGGKTHILKYYAQIRKLLKIPVFILLDADGTDILDDLKSILEEKDKIYLISKGEIEDILPHELIIRAINSYYSTEATITEDDLNKNEPMTKILYNLYKEKGYGEFHKAKFAQLLQENITSESDSKGEIDNIFDVIRSY